MSTVKFTSTKLNGTNKKGILKPDANGYYTMPIGGLNAFNSAGEYYTLEGAKELFTQSSIFMRRVTNGCLKGELGHPKRLPGMSMDDYVSRLLSIEETNVTAHFSEIWLDETFGKSNPQFNNTKLVAIMAKIKPAGPHAESLKASFDNPNEEVCFSIRAMTKDYLERGQTYRVLQQIVTWDAVTEPGIANARKWNSPSLESTSEQVVRKANIERLINSNKSTISTEDSRIIIQESLSVFDKKDNIKLINLPTISKW